MRSSRFVPGVIVASSMLAGCGGEQEKPAPAAVEAQIVQFVAEDGVQLTGTWFGVPGSRVSIVLLPALTHSRSTWATAAGQFAQSGWSVLAVDMRDQGDSDLPPQAPAIWVGNDTLSALKQYMKDVKAAVSFAQGKGPDAKIVVIGAGLGGYCGLYEAVNNPVVAGVALFSPPESKNLSTPAIMARFGDRPLAMISELPAEAIRTTPRTLDSWIGRGSVIEVKDQMPQPAVRLENKAAAVAFINRWIASAAR